MAKYYVTYKDSDTKVFESDKLNDAIKVAKADWTSLAAKAHISTRRGIVASTAAIPQNRILHPGRHIPN